MKQGSIELQNVKFQFLKKKVMLIEMLCSMKIRLFLKRRLLAYKQRLSEKFNSEIPELHRSEQQRNKEICSCSRWRRFCWSTTRASWIAFLLTLGSIRTKKLKLSEQEVRRKIIEEKKAESPLEATNKTTQLNIFHQLKQQNSSEKKNGKTNNSVSVRNKKQSVITKLIEIGLSSSRLERSRVILQALFKKSRLSFNELLDIQVESSATELNLLTFWSLKTKNWVEALNALHLLQVSKHIISNMLGKDVTQQFSTSLSWIKRF